MKSVLDIDMIQELRVQSLFVPHRSVYKKFHYHTFATLIATHHHACCLSVRASNRRLRACVQHSEHQNHLHKISCCVMLCAVSQQLVNTEHNTPAWHGRGARLGRNAQAETQNHAAIHKVYIHIYIYSMYGCNQHPNTSPSASRAKCDKCTELRAGVLTRRRNSRRK